MNARAQGKAAQMNQPAPISLAYMLDTNIVSYFVRGQYPQLNSILLAALAHHRCCVSVVTYAELLYGLALNPQALKHKSRTDSLIAELSVLPWLRSAADVYGPLKAELRLQGRPIGELDTQIAAHALAEGLTLVTHNTKHFEGIAGLQLEDWTQ